VCFDTVFHETMPAEATTYPLPERFRDEGLRRYGFHGLSCESIVRRLRLVTGGFPERAAIAHLGSGCSVTALRGGESVDTTMGLTPTGGVVMGTRPGDLDPGVVLYLLRKDAGGVNAVEEMLNHAAGMVALSGMKNDVKAVREAAAKGDEQARLALKVFTRSVRKAIGGYAWLLGGLDALIFAGGIGEHDAKTRSDVLEGLGDVGFSLDEDANGARAKGVRRVDDGRQIPVWVVPAEEDLMIALHVERMMVAGK
jgi:acetate kinase